jgi:molybdopterin-guanine dinucleotide biosynthesis protein A
VQDTGSVPVESTRTYSALILAGGRGSRLGGPAKPTLTVGGTPLIDRVLDAVTDAVARIVVGPPGLGPILLRRAAWGVRLVSEDPPGGGPVAGLAAGLAHVQTAQVALLAADLPFLTQAALTQLHDALAAPETDPAQSTVDGAVFVDGDGRRQSLCGVWWTASLRRRVEALGAPLAGRSLRELLAGLAVAEIGHRAPGPPPWYDCDTKEELDRAEEWADDRTG